MNPVVKFVLFAVLLLASFGGGAALGAVTLGDDDPTPAHTVHDE